MDSYPELDQLNFQALILRFAAPLSEGQGGTQEGAPAEIYYDEIALRIATRGGRRGIAFLLHSQQKADTIRLHAILKALATFKSPFVDAWTLFRAYLHDKRPLLIADAIDGLRLHAYRAALDDVLRLKSHSSPYVLSAVLRFLGAHAPDLAIPILLDSLNSRHYLVRRHAAAEAQALCIVEAVPLLIQMIQDPHPHVREAVEIALSHLRDAGGRQSG